ncbi:hypothetical protein Tco_0489912 [Tanacetum coccineum]
MSPPLRHPNPNLAIQRRKLTSGGPTSLGATSEEGAHPQLSNANFIVEADPEIFAPKDSISYQQEDLSNILKDTRSTFFTPDSPTDEPIVVSDESEEEEDAKKDKDTEDTSVPPPFLSASVDEVPSASALQVLRRLGSIFTSVYAAVQKLKKDSWLELQFSLADNSKLNVVYLLNRS